MSKINYSAVDAAIIAAIQTGCHRMINFERNDAVMRAARDVEPFLPKNHRGQRRPPHRTIDARLQSLKRQGKIEFAIDLGWRLQPSHKAPE